MIWKSDLDIGIENMNNQHKKLIDLMGILYDNNEKSVDKKVLEKNMSDLFDYTVRHFKEEEKYLESNDYSGLPTHKIIHQDLLAKLKTHYESFQNGDNTNISDEVFVFLNFWLSSHIKGIDMKYGKELSNS
ncbi:MAG: bacteriohemerythrin [Oligoflexales bacterium]